MSDDLLPVDEQLCFALYAASRAMTAAYQTQLAELELTYPQYLVMIALWTRDVRSVGDLGTELKLDSGTLTPLLKRLEARALVTRKRRPDDERVVEIALTTAGKRLRQRGCLVAAAVARVAGITRGDANRLRDELHSLSAALDVSASSRRSTSSARRTP